MRSFFRILGRVLSYVFVFVLGGAAAITLLVLGLRQTPYGKLIYLDQLISQVFIGEYDSALAADYGASAMVASTGDRWSYYVPASSYTDYSEQMTNSYVGIGITIVPADEGGFRVEEITPGGPAAQAGMMIGDVLVAVDGTDCTVLSTAETRDLVRGEAGSEVVITVSRAGERIDLTITRESLQTAVAEHTMLPGGVGKLTIYNFDERCAQETIAAIEELTGMGATALIFDVRGNPGGYKDELVKVLDYLLPEGDLFISEDYLGVRETDTSDAACVELPMAVLVNGSSYSAAEFFAAALRDYDAAVIVGTQTCGKGYFQNTYLLPDGSAAAISIGRYFTPKGVSLADVGITPDQVVELSDAQTQSLLAGTLEPKDDPQLQAAINALKTKNVP